MVPRWLLLLVSIPLVCGGLCGVLYWLIELRPQYVELSVPETNGMIWWGYTERSVLQWDDGARAYLWRREAQCSLASCRSWQAIWQHFDRYLTDAGWIRVDDRFGTPCGISAPETEFMEVGDSGYVVYIQESQQENPFCQGPEICLAIWQASDEYFHIVMSSDNPSFMTEVGRCMG
jgi:hypothetical protein